MIPHCDYADYLRRCFMPAVAPINCIRYWLHLRSGINPFPVTIGTVLFGATYNGNITVFREFKKEENKEMGHRVIPSGWMWLSKNRKVLHSMYFDDTQHSVYRYIHTSMKTEGTPMIPFLLPDHAIRISFSGLPALKNYGEEMDLIRELKVQEPLLPNKGR